MSYQTVPTSNVAGTSTALTTPGTVGGTIANPGSTVANPGSVGGTSAAPTTSATDGAMNAFRKIHHPNPLVPGDNVKKNSLALVLADIFVPPLGVYYGTEDLCETGINTVLWCFGIVPAIVHSFLVSFSSTRCSCAGPTAAVAPGQAPTPYGGGAGGATGVRSGTMAGTTTGTGAAVNQPLLAGTSTGTGTGVQPIRAAAPTTATTGGLPSAGGAPTSQSLGEATSFPVQQQVGPSGIMAPKVQPQPTGMLPPAAQQAVMGALGTSNPNPGMTTGTGTYQY